MQKRRLGKSGPDVSAMRPGSVNVPLQKRTRKAFGFGAVLALAQALGGLQK